MLLKSSELISVNPTLLQVKVASAKLRLPEISLPVDAVHFQLKYMSHLLERPASGEKDDRVSFIPDAWQRKLLDIVDQGTMLMKILGFLMTSFFLSC